MKANAKLQFMLYVMGISQDEGVVWEFSSAHMTDREERKKCWL